MKSDKSAWDRLIDWLKNSRPDDRLPEDLEKDFSGWIAEAPKAPIALVVRDKKGEVVLPVDIEVHPKKITTLVSVLAPVKTKTKPSRKASKVKKNARPFYK